MTPAGALPSLPDAAEALRRAIPGPLTRWVPVFDALGHVLAEDVRLKRASPTAALAAMDGVAVQASDQPRLLECVGQSQPAAPCREPLPDGSCITILTGAPLPSGANAVIPLEQLEAARQPDPGPVRVPAVAAGAHVVPAGAAFSAGTVLAAGTRLGPGAVTALADAGIAEVPIAWLPVRLVPVGDELVSGTVVDSVCPVLKAWMRRWMVDVERLDPVPDHPLRLLEALEGPEPVVITTGGTGRSSQDIVARAAIGEPLLDGIAVKPGKPTKAYRLRGGRLWIALPGNPSAALLLFRALVLPLLVPSSAPGSRVSARLTSPLDGHAARWRVAPVSLGPHGADPVPEGPSVAAGWWLGADGVVVLAPGTRLAAGQPVEVLPW